ncbi:MAG: transcriptional regulator [Hyphomicrobiales bacterium]|nr:MAG: transcriptional regulator [Hyphomicrobiales bacterium]
MKPDHVTRTLAELGNETRLAIFRLLLKSGKDGVTIGEIGKRLEVPPSTLGFHLRGLVEVGLVTQQRQGRSVFCFAELEMLTSVLHSLEDECCADQQSNELCGDAA